MELFRNNRVQLTRDQMDEACIAGVLRQNENVEAGRKHLKGTHEDKSYDMHCEGIMAEYAFALFNGLPFKGKGELRAPDVGNYEVRSSKYATAHLILKKSDPDHRRCVLVTGCQGRYIIHGWIWSHDGKITKLWTSKQIGSDKKPRWGFFVPQRMLTPFDHTDFGR